jgi:hypothetical protein
MNGGVNSIAITDDTLYMASRNQIVPFDFKSWQCTKALIGTGQEIISGLLAMPGCLVAAS